MYTEQNIRGLAINFLRQHYKLRPRSGTSGTQVVHRPHFYQGVTIDARLAYQKPDLSWFTATVEASSVDSAHEVLYRVNWFRIGAHALLFTLLVLSAYMAVTQVQGESLWAQFGRPGVYTYLIGISTVLWLVSVGLLSQLKYYRYIYAIAQFIRFHADAQWVAYDKKIFDDMPGRYYRELQRQCLRFGFGLMEIQEKSKVRWVIEPSHIDQFQGSRSRLPVWLAAAKAPPLLAGLRNRLPLRPGAKAPEPTVAKPVPTDGMTDPLSVDAYLPMHVRKDDFVTTIVPAKKGRTPWFKQPARAGKRLRWKVRHAIRSLYPREIRRRPGYYELPWGVVTAFIVTLICFGTLTYLQSEWTQERRPGQAAAAPDLNPLETARSEADSDASPEVRSGEYNHKLSAKSVTPIKDIAPGQTDDEAVVVPASPPAKTIHYLRIDTAGVIERSYGCGPLIRSNATGYILVEGSYPEYEVALERATYLNGALRIPSALLLADCLQEGLPGYLLYVGDLLTTEAKANLGLRAYANAYGLELEARKVE